MDMNKVNFVNFESPTGEVLIFAIIDKGNKEFTSMPKSVYDEMIVNQQSGTISQQQGANLND